MVVTVVQSQGHLKGQDSIHVERFHILTGKMISVRQNLYDIQGREHLPKLHAVSIAVTIRCTLF